ncbi:hypothetical protein UIS43_10930 [Nocardiopsis sp. LDBS0036]|uniref:hypothetical protein n=1 Tax=Nocardiopsis TaxID=2013 RepID=UPI00200E0BED|nr:hypothetical protein [Nocardiopsis dassonvillei]MCK9870324.1 hypothetical protein [Nocardiopsis dassonvillei]
MDITLAEAWTLWWSGQQLTDHTIHGLSVLWLARLGKLLAFLAGTTIVLDVIGPERLIAWSQKASTDPKLKRGVITALFAMGLALGVVAEVLAWQRNDFTSPDYNLRWALLVGFVSSLLGANAERIAGWVGHALAREGIEKWVRRVAIPLFFLGFALDYMAS